MKCNLEYSRPKLIEATKSCIAQNHVIKKELDISSYDNMVIYPGRNAFEGGCLDNKNVVLRESKVTKKWFYSDTPVAFEEREIDHSNETVVYLGMWVSCWGHNLTDCLKHIWCFLPEIKKRYPFLNDAKLVYITERPDQIMPTNFMELLSLLGIDDVKRVTKPTRFKKVYIPDQCFSLDHKDGFRYCTPEYVSLIETIIQKAYKDDDFPKKHSLVYLTRNSWKADWRRKQRVDYGEKLLEDYFLRLASSNMGGGGVIHPECMSLREMIHCMQNCSKLFVTEGSIGFNALFMKPHSELIVLRKAAYVNDYQVVINQAKNLNVTYIDANRTDFFFYDNSMTLGPFFMCVSDELKRYLEDAGIKVGKRFILTEYCRYLKAVVFCRVLYRLSCIKHFIFDRLGR